MRLLDVSPVDAWPPRRGSAQRTYNLLKGLAEHHEVRQFCFPQPDGRRGLKRSLDESGMPGGYRRVRLAHPLAGAALAVGERAWTRAPILSGLALDLTRPRVLRELLGWAEVALVSFPWQFRHCARLAENGTPLVYASMNVEAEKFRSWARAAGDPALAAPWLQYVERCERRAVRSAALVLAVSEEDRDAFVRRHGADRDRIAVVPNGADPESIEPPSPESRRAARARLGLPDRPTAIFVGADIAPNRCGLEWVERASRATDRFTFVVAGKVSRYVTEPNLIALGEIDEVEPLLAAADVALCPVEHGGGTKTKLITAMAAGLPSVAFGASVRGTAARDEVHLLSVEPDTRQIVAALDRLADDPALAERLGSAARALVVDRYAWKSIAAQLSERLESLSPVRARQPV